jgi:processive 1,2-diacylglycerol beta-glucosyltransferase
MKVLLLYASLGAGHKRAAQAIQEVLQQNSISAESRDLLDFLPGPMGPFYSWSYTFMVDRARWLWSAFYRWMDHPSRPYEPARSITQRWQFPKLLRYLQEEKYTHVIATHFTPAALLTDWRKDSEVSSKVYSMVTDYIAHRCWKRDGLDHYFVAREEVALQLGDAGIPLSKITACGIPVSPAFSEPLSREEARTRWECKMDESVLLVLTSGLKLAKAEELLADLKEVKGNVRFLVSAGKDPAREQKLKDFCSDDPRFTIFGFSPKIPEMMRAADLLISKPGGLTVSEALAVGLPQILFSPIPGQEEANAEFSEKNGAALCIEAGRGNFREAVNTLLADPKRLHEMSSSALRIAKPHAAKQIVNAILADSAALAKI